MEGAQERGRYLEVTLKSTVFKSLSQKKKKKSLSQKPKELTQRIRKHTIKWTNQITSWHRGHAPFQVLIH